QDDGVSFDDIWVNPLSDAVNDSSTVLPMPAESDWQDRILVFPEGSGIEPLYLVFKTTARNESGVVTGKGEDITGIWLEKSRTRIRSTNTIPDSR
ncbi:S-type pyocin domain-containing protein, partial [Photobacterium sp. GB-36]